MSVFKPVVFFHAPEPLSLLVRVGFHGGQPWTFYPAATDYIHDLVTVVSPAATNRNSVPPETGTPPGDVVRGPLGSELLALRDTSGASEPTGRPGQPRIAPPWDEPEADRTGSIAIVSDGFAGFPEPRRTNPESLRPSFALAPWLVPNHPPTASQLGGDPSSLGLEWCGLRVGYPAELEGGRPAVDPASWWSKLREVPGQDVAVRGERERFLFYDGAVNLPGPVRVCWSDEERQALLIQPRRFESFPRYPSLLDWWWYSECERNRFATAVPIPAVFVVSREEGKEARGTVIEGLTPTPDPMRVSLADLHLGEADLVRRLGEALQFGGLTSEASRSLLATWEDDFFRKPGLRMITVLPQWMYDVMLPLEVFPVPEEILRVGLVCKELEELETGTASWGLLSDGERWRAEPWRMPSEDVLMTKEAFGPGEEIPLQVGENGEVFHKGQVGGRGLSTDGTFLAWQVLDGYSCRVFRADLVRNTVLELASFEDVVMKRPGGVSISADGSRIAFGLEPPGEERTTFLVDLQDRVRYRLPIRSSYPQLSADGTRILYLDVDYESTPKREALMLFDLQTSTTTTLFQNDDAGSLFTRDLSGDGNSVAFAFGPSEREVYVIDLVEETILNVSRSPEDDRAPSLSHDGRRVVFESERFRNHDLCLVDLERRSLEVLTNHPADDRFATLTADGKTLFYRNWEEARFIALDLESRTSQFLPGTRGVYNHRFSPNGSRTVAFSRRGMVVIDVPREE